jgi:hypothetical protein
MFGFLSLIPLRMWAYGAAIAAILGGLVYVHHSIRAQGEAAQLAVDAPKLKAAADAHAVDQSLIKAYADAITASNAQAKLNQDKAAAQQVQAAAAVKVAQANAQDAVRALAGWTAKYAAALRQPACNTVLTGVLCPDLQSY